MRRRVVLAVAVVLGLVLLTVPTSAQGRFWVLVNGALRYTGTVVVNGTLDLVPTGMRATASNGVLTLLGLGSGADESLVVDLDATANTIALSSGTGADKLTWTGNVGIGTTSPSERLTIYTPNSTLNGLGIYGTDNANKKYAQFNTTANEGTFNLYGSDGVTAGVRLNGGTAVPSYINAGNVGIGTTSPGAANKLEVIGHAVATSIRGAAVAFANVPSTPVEGMLVAITDSSTATWGATITGGGANHVLAFYNGSAWTVAGK